MRNGGPAAPLEQTLFAGAAMQFIADELLCRRGTPLWIRVLTCVYNTGLGGPLCTTFDPVKICFCFLPPKLHYLLCTGA
jgi:hypothetical protein